MSLSASLTRLCISRSLMSSYQRHRFHKIEITATFLLLILKRIDYLGREKENSKKNKLISWFGYRLDHKLFFCITRYIDQPSDVSTVD